MEEKALAFIDLLGFSAMVEKDHLRARDILNDFYNISFKIIKSKSVLKGHLFSDSLLVYSNDKAALVNAVCEIYRESFKKNKDYQDRSNYFLLPRGGISIGMVNIEDRVEAPNLTKDFIVSPALVHSAKMEKNIKGSRLLVAVRTGSNEEETVTWNQDISSILYGQDFNFWEKYQYKDALWFADPSKEYDARKKETEGLIDIAIALVKNNSANSIALEHHADTLRIGLLSYSHLFEAVMSSPLVERILSEFAEDKYWKVWIAIFEMAKRSPDNWAVPGTQKFIDFYKRVCLSSGWIKLLKEVNKSGGSYQKSLLGNFIKELNINAV